MISKENSASLLLFKTKWLGRDFHSLRSVRPERGHAFALPTALSLMMNSMESSARLDLSHIIDGSKIGGFHWRIFILCSLCLIMDGFDVQSMGYVAPALIKDWRIASSSLGPVFSAALVGVLVGSLFFSVLADRIGRRPVLIFAALYFSALTILTAQANTVNQVLLIRFLAGIGLGGIMPNAMALAGEYSPARIRVPAMMIVSCGFTAGAAVGGFVAAWLIPHYGWRSVFYFGGTVPLVIALLMLIWLPESLQYLAVRGKHSAKISKWLRLMNPEAPIGPNTQYAVREEKKEGIPAIHLFREGRSMTTILLWIVNFMNLLNLYFLSSWIPTVVSAAGHATSIAVLVGTTTQVGGTLGTFGNSWFINRFGFIPTLVANSLIACAAIALIGQPFLSLTILFIVVFIAGWGIVGGQPGVNALAAIYYPTYLRSTGIGWGLGIGRIGAIVGPIVGGELIRMKWTPAQVFVAAAVPAAISALTLLFLRRSLNGREGNRNPVTTAEVYPTH